MYTTLKLCLDSSCWPAWLFWMVTFERRCTFGSYLPCSCLLRRQTNNTPSLNFMGIFCNIERGFRFCELVSNFARCTIRYVDIIVEIIINVCCTVTARWTFKLISIEKALSKRCHPETDVAISLWCSTWSIRMSNLSAKNAANRVLAMN